MSDDPAVTLAEAVMRDLDCPDVFGHRDELTESVRRHLAKLQQDVATLILEIAVSHRQEERIRNAAIVLARSNVPSMVPSDGLARYDAGRWIDAHDRLLRVLGWTRADLVDAGDEAFEPQPAIDPIHWATAVDTSGMKRVGLNERTEP